MKKNNKGLTLVELIIVIAIMAILTGAVFSGVGLISGKPAKVCADKLQSALQQDRTIAMGKLDAKLKLYRDAEGRIWVQEVVQSIKKDESGNPVNEEETRTPEQIGDAGVTVQYKIKGETEYIDLGNELNPLILGFNRSNGSFKDLSQMGTGYADHYCEEIKISKGHTVKYLKLSYLTGKITLE